MDSSLPSNGTGNDAGVSACDPGVTASDTQRTEMLAYYWRKGIPSVVLAIVTLALAGYSYWFVQPNVQLRYRDICRRNLLLLDGNSSATNLPEASEPARQWQIEIEANETAADPSKRGSDARRRTLEQTQLCLRRLIIWDKSDDSVRYQSAQVSNLLADWFLDRVRSLSAEDATREERSALLSRSLSERKKAADSMRLLQKRNGSLANRASMWLARRQLDDNPEMTSIELDGIASRIAEWVAADPSYAEAQSLLFESFVRHSLRVERLSASEKQSLQIKSFEVSTQNASIVDLAWAAEANSISDLPAGQAAATKTLQTYWEKGDDESQSVETLTSVFRCLILVNSIKEGQIFLSEQIQQIASFEQPKFRSLTAAACLRQILLNTIATKEAVVSSANQALFSMAMQLNPESTELLAMVEWICEPSNAVTKMGLDSDNGLMSLLNSCIGLRNGADINEVTTNLIVAIRATPVHAALATRFANRLIVSESISSREAILWLSAINSETPDVLIAWSDRANLHLKNHEFAKGVECYETLHRKLPDNESIAEALTAAKSQLATEANRDAAK